MFNLIAFQDCGQGWDNDVCVLTGVSREELVEAVWRCRACSDMEELDDYVTDRVYIISVQIYGYVDMVEDLLTYDNPDVYVYTGSKEHLLYIGSDKLFGVVCGIICAVQYEVGEIPENIERFE